MRINTGSDVTRRKIAKLSNVEFPFPTRWEVHVRSISQSSPRYKAILYRIDLPFFVHLRRVRSTTAILCHAFVEMNVLDFPLIETPREAMHDFLAGSCREIFGNEDIYFVFIRERIYLALGIRRIYILFLRGLSRERRDEISR